MTTPRESSKQLPLNKSKTTNALWRVATFLTPALREHAKELCNQLDEDGSVSLAVLHQRLFPLAETASASAQLSKLLKSISEAASRAGLLLQPKYSGAKSAGVEGRRLFFTGAKPELTPDTEGLNAIGQEKVISGQTGQVLVAEARVVLLTCNDFEFQAVRETFASGSQPRTYRSGGIAVDDLEVHGNLRVLHHHCGQGNRASQRATADIERAFEPLAVIAVGIAFGVKSGEHELGDVLVSTFVCDYEFGRVSSDGSRSLRTGGQSASKRLVDALRHTDLCQRNGPNKERWPKVRLGGLLSGEKLVDNIKYREELKALSARGDILGGEMESVGICTALEGRPVDWVVVKGISDWADGNKNRDKATRQLTAARNAAVVVKALLDQHDLYADQVNGSIKRTRFHALVDHQQLPEACGEGPLVDGQYGLLTDLAAKADEAPAGRPTVVAFDDIVTWARDPKDKPLYALLGEYGMGKTTTCQRVAQYFRQLRNEGEAVPPPLYFDLRKVERVIAATVESPGYVPTLRETIEDCLRHGYLHANGESPTYADVVELIDESGLVIFDGLDEVLSRIGEKQGLRFTANLLKVISEARARSNSRTGNDKAIAPRVLISCRTQFFRNLAEQNSHLTGEHRGAYAGQNYRALLLLPFTDEQVHAYLRAAFPESDLQHLSQQLAQVHDLRELTRRPFTLKLVAEFIPRIEQLRLRGGMLTGAALYREVVCDWLIRDKEKQSFQPEDKVQLAGDLAARLWKLGQRGISARELEAWLGKWLAAQDPHADFQVKPRDLLQEDLRNSTFLKRTDGPRPEDSRFEFAHSSLQEYFLADFLFRALNTGEPHDGPARSKWALPRVSDETLDFLGQMLMGAGESPGATSPALSTLSRWRVSYLREASELQLAYALRAFRKGWPCPTLVDMSLRGMDLSDWHLGAQEEESTEPSPVLDLSSANFEGAKLAQTKFWYVRLSRANMARSSAAQAEFLHCEAERSVWTEADLSGATFRCCDLSSAEGLENSARLIRCTGLAVSAEGAVDVNLELTSHSAAIHVCAFFPNSQQLVSASGDGTLRIWNIFAGECVRVLHGHVGSVLGCAVSDDGGWIASSGADRTIRIWSVKSGEIARVLKGHEDCVSSCAFAGNSKLVASASWDKTVRIWDAASGECLHILRGHDGRVNSCAFSPDGRYLASASSDACICIWDPVSGKSLRVLRGHKTYVNCVAFSPDGRWLVSAAYDRSLRIWSVADGKCVRVLRGHENEVSSCTFSPSGRRLASAAGDGSVRIWDALSGECAYVLRTSNREVFSCAFSPDEHWLAAASIDGCLSIWNAKNGERVRAANGKEASVLSCDISPDGKSIVAAARDQTVRVFNALSGKRVLTITGHGCAFFPDGRRIVSISNNEMWGIWDVETGEPKGQAIATGYSAISCAISADGRKLATGSISQPIKIWDTENVKFIRTLDEPGDFVTCCRYSPDGRWLATTNFWTNVVVLCDAGTYQRSHTFSTSDVAPASCTFSADSRRLAAALSDGSLNVWNVLTGEQVAQLERHTGRANCCAFSPDGRWLVSGGEDCSLRLWDVSSRECLRVFTGHEGTVNTCAFAANGQWIASGADDGTLRIWDPQTGKCIRVYLLVAGGSAAWNVPSNEVLHAEGTVWRHLSWRGRLEDDQPAVWPLEAGPHNVPRIIVQP
jgi:WD40 repeat protein/nucleoside phosphorylase/uncharacterized protein YjbI with pentapeptide repeats